MSILNKLFYYYMLLVSLVSDICRYKAEDGYKGTISVYLQES